MNFGASLLNLLNSFSYANVTIRLWRGQMRFHSCRTSSTNLLIGDSQVRNLIFPNFTIISTPGGQVHHAYSVLPSPGEFDLITLFIGANILLDGESPKDIEPKDVADELIRLADELCQRVAKVLVIGFPPRLGKPAGIKAVNLLLRKAKEECNWWYRALSDHIYDSKQFTDSRGVHLTSPALGSIKSFLKNKVLYKKYSDQLHKAGHRRNHECTGYCRCGFWH